MIDIKKIEQNFEAVKKNLEMRGFETSKLDEVLSFNSSRKDLLKNIEAKRAQLNQASKKIGELIKAGEDPQSAKEDVNNIKSSMQSDEEKLKSFEEKLTSVLSEIPNLIDEDTPIGSDEESNVELSSWGEVPTFSFEVLDHVDLGEKLGMLDFQTAAKLTGARFVVYKHLLARLERAIANYMIDFHLDRDYEEIIPPFIVNSDSLYGTGQLPKFGEDLFKLENTDWYLIPTAEVPVTNLKKKEIVPINELPLKYVAHTPCFRSEAGSYGRDTRGLIRMHQFNKVEMVQITTKEKSEAAHEEMIDSAKKILEGLGLPYRAMRLCTGDIGFGSRKTIDLEVWIPSQDKYREISSISNCWDFQARRAKIRYKADGKNEFVHTLNGSGLAVGRTLVAILENYQQEDGSIKVPEVLIPYMRGVEIIKKS